MPPVVATGLTEDRDLEDFRTPTPIKAEGLGKKLHYCGCLKKEVFFCCDGKVMVLT